MKTALYLIIFTYCAFVACGKEASSSWDPLMLFGYNARPNIEEKVNNTRPVVEERKSAETNVKSEYFKLFQGKPTTPRYTEEPNKSPGAIASASSKIVHDGSNLSEANISSLPVNNSPLSQVGVQGQTSGAKIGSATSTILTGDGDIDDTDMESSPMNNSPISDSNIKNTDAVIGSATSDVKLGEGSAKGVTIRSNPENNSPVTGSSFEL